MTADELRALQAPVKARYKEAPESARKTLRAVGRLDVANLTCRIAPGAGQCPEIVAGLHPAAGGDGSAACSADLLLQALASCAGVTLCAVSTALGIPVRGGSVTAEGDLDFRGTLGVSKEAPVGFTAIRLAFALDTDADDDQLATLRKLTERYCVVAQSVKGVEATVGRAR